MQSPPASSPTVIDALREKTKECTVKAVCGRRYVRHEALKAWMREELQRLIDHVYKGDYRKPFEAVDIDGRSHWYLLVWAILLNIETGDYGKYIESFRTLRIDDRKIPVKITELREVFEINNPGEKVLAHLCKEFGEQQWRYRAVQFELNMNPNCLEQDILPICKKARVKAGGSAEVWQIAVQEEFVDDRLRKAVCNNPHAIYDDSEYGKVCPYIHKILFETRTDIFKSVINSLSKRFKSTKVKTSRSNGTLSMAYELMMA
jgi:hypothetical protein